MNTVSTKAVDELDGVVNKTKATSLFGLARSSYYYQPKPADQQKHRGGGNQPSALNAGERQEILDVTHSDKYIDKTPYDIYASLLDEGKYLASIRSFYRVLGANNETTRRERSRSAIKRIVPVLHATRPNEVWSWDISPMRTIIKGKFYYLYAIIDIFSRFVPGFCVEEIEDKELAKVLFEQTCQKQHIKPDTLTVHADNGPQMRSILIDELFSEMKITKSHSRPRVSNDNPYSEALFKTTKYVPSFPNSFPTISEARKWCNEFFSYYNYEHYHSGIDLLTPASVHHDTWHEIVADRQKVLDGALAKHPDRFRKGRRLLTGPQPAWINEPSHEEVFTH